MKHTKIFSIIAAIMLFLAIPSIWPYSYYKLLRWVVTGIAAFIAYSKNEEERRGGMWVMIGIAILFNPLVPFYLAKGTWAVLDFIAALTFLFSIRKA